ncbi:MAG: hypothetical protein ACREBV_04450 [Candidatus Zixiibacteriota bacterium]
MNRKISFLTFGILIIWILIQGSGCKKSELCCSPENLGGLGSDSLSYCNDYSEAVFTFLRQPGEVADREGRKAAFELFFQDVQACSTTLCIETAVDTTTRVPLFKENFAEMHEIAQGRPVEGESRKVRLLFCGFESGLQVSLK